MESALRGARAIGHKPMSSMTPKRAKSNEKRRGIATDKLARRLSVSPKSRNDRRDSKEDRDLSTDPNACDLPLWQFPVFLAPAFESLCRLREVRASEAPGTTLASRRFDRKCRTFPIVHADRSAVVEPEIKFRQIAVQVLFGAVLMDALHAAIEQAEHVFSGVAANEGVGLTTHMLTRRATWKTTPPQLANTSPPV